MENNREIPNLYSVRETAELLRRSRNTVYRILERGELQSVRVGARTMITATALHDYLTPTGGPHCSQRARDALDDRGLPEAPANLGADD